MLDMKLIRTNPELVKENIRKKFQDKKLPLVDEVLELDAKRRELQKEGDSRRAMRNSLSAQIGRLMKEKNVDEANKVKAQVVENNERIAAIERGRSQSFFVEIGPLINFYPAEEYHQNYL